MLRGARGSDKIYSVWVELASQKGPSDPTVSHAVATAERLGSSWQGPSAKFLNKIIIKKYKHIYHELSDPGHCWVTL